MSFEVYVQFFDRGEPAGAVRTLIRPLFPIVEVESEADYWLVRYDDTNECHISLTPLATDPSLVESLCVHRPCAAPGLWDALLAVLRLGQATLYFPGDAPPLVASDAVGDHLPADMVEAMGIPRVVQSGREIVDILRDA